MLRLLVACVVLCGVASAEPMGAARVGIVDTSRFFKAGGIARWVDARAKLDGERSTYKPAEAPPGAKKIDLPSIDDLKLPPEEKAKLRRKMEEIERDENDKNVWRAHEAEVLEPIEMEVQIALVRFARDRGIGIVLDRTKLDAALLVVVPGADVTDAFIKDYNTRNAPKPARH